MQKVVGQEKETRKFIEIVERMLIRWGYTHTDGKIYALLLLSERPLTINELVQLTGLSRSSISTSLSRLSREYFVNVRKDGKTKLFYPIPAFLEKFLKQPKEILEKEVKPLQRITSVLMEREQSPEQKIKFEEILFDLNVLECVLSKIIKMEEEESECFKG
ncbi:helix-turn-helix domain-containing protein [Thermococcus atlanticus]